MGDQEAEKSQGGQPQALMLTGQTVDLALLNAIHLWAEATTDAESACRSDLLSGKRKAVSAFFAQTGKHPEEITPLEVQSWRIRLEEKGFKPATVYARISRLSSFYEWAMRDPS